VPANVTVRLSVGAVGSDNDDTILKHTGEAVHDGRLARFSRGLSELIRTRAEISPDCEARYRDEGVIFDEGMWKTFRVLTGRSEKTVLEDMVRVANQSFRTEITVEEFRGAVARILEEKFSDLMVSVEPDHGLIEFFAKARAEGIPLAVCSASAEQFVQRALRHFELNDQAHAHLGVDVDSSSKLVVHDLFSEVRGGVVKKTSDGGYCGLALGQVCKNIGADPKGTVMFGDTMSDVGAAVKAGLKLVIIRILPEEAGDVVDAAAKGRMDREDPERSCRKTQFGQQVMTFGAQESECWHMLREGSERPTVLVVHDFGQIRLHRSLAPGEVASYELEVPGDGKRQE
jgi:beta-phosphoglucomutase-like phosphatase (HAD superfamily)